MNRSHRKSRRAAPVLAALFAVTALSATFGCSGDDTQYDVAPTVTGVDLSKRPSPYLDVCEVNKTVCQSGAYCVDVTFADEEHGTTQHTSLCTESCKVNADCTKFDSQGATIACVGFVSASVCAVLCNEGETCPNGLTCKSGICVHVPKR